MGSLRVKADEIKWCKLTLLPRSHRQALILTSSSLITSSPSFTDSEFHYSTCQMSPETTWKSLRAQLGAEATKIQLGLHQHNYRTQLDGQPSPWSCSKERGSAAHRVLEKHAAPTGNALLGNSVRF